MKAETKCAYTDSAWGLIVTEECWLIVPLFLISNTINISHQTLSVHEFEISVIVFVQEGIAGITAVF